MEREELLEKLHLLHTTKLGAERIKRNSGIDGDAIEYCKRVVESPECVVFGKGKNIYCETQSVRITVNAYSYTVITAHRIGK